MKDPRVFTTSFIDVVLMKRRLFFSRRPVVYLRCEKYEFFLSENPPGRRAWYLRWTEHYFLIIALNRFRCWFQERARECWRCEREHVLGKSRKKWRVPKVL